MGDASLFEVLHRRKQVVAVAACEVQRQRALLPQNIAQTSVTGELEKQARELSQCDDVAQRDDVLVPQVAERLGFRQQTLTAACVVRNLKREVAALAA